MTRRTYLLAGGLASLLLTPACGGGSGVSSSSGPSSLPTPGTTGLVGALRPIQVTVFLDENGNRALDAAEQVRLPHVEIASGSVRARSAVLTGEATLQLAEGPQAIEIVASSLPPFYRPPAPVTVTIPSSGPVALPVTLPVGGNRPTVYMAFGDSITNGEPEVGDMNGYRLMLQTRLRAHFGAATIANEGVDATRSRAGAARIGDSLSRVRPAFTLIHYGTNDWNDSECRDLPCFTTSSLRSMVQQINSSGGHAFLATILPTNTGYDDRAPESRNEWVAQQNIYIRQVADEEGAVLVDLNGAFYRSSIPFPSLFVDHVHPTAPGYEIMAQTWFDAITKAYSRILN